LIFQKKTPNAPADKKQEKDGRSYCSCLQAAYLNGEGGKECKHTLKCFGLSNVCAYFKINWAKNLWHFSTVLMKLYFLVI